MNENEYFDVYLADMKEHLELLNESLLKLDKFSEDKEIINTIFRSFHSMKGSTAAMNYNHSAEIIHKMEDLLQEMREGNLKADSHIIELLFECHDFVENFIEKVSLTGNDEGIDCPHILNQLEKYIKRQIPEAKKTKIKFEEPKSNQKISLSDAELDYVVRKVSIGNKVYMVNLKISEDCMFKAIRAWMAYNELEQNSELIKVYPPQPSQEDFADSSFKFESNDIKAVVISNKDAEQLCTYLNSVLMEMDRITVENYPIEESLTSNIVNDIIDSCSEADYNQYEYLQAYIEEIKSHVLFCEQHCMEAALDLSSLKGINDLWRSFHIIKGLAGFVKHKVIYSISAEIEKILNDCMKQKMRFGEEQLDEIVTSLTYIKELCNDLLLIKNTVYMQKIDDYLKELSANKETLKNNPIPNQKDQGINSMKLGQILVEGGVIDQKNIDDMLAKQKDDITGLKLGQMLVQDEKASLKDVVEALSIQSAVKPDTKPQSFIRIPESKVDSLVDMLGELLIIQSLHKQEISNMLVEVNRMDSRLSNNIIRMERITKDIQIISMSLRMVSLKQTFQKLARIGHDTSKELDKNIDIILRGEETEIDRSIVEKIQDPLMHLVRNSISHGIEAEQVREGKGKPLQGKVVISAYNKRGFVFIEIMDDGKGLSVEKIYEKALEKGLVDPSKGYTDEEIIKFIYLPGFSTQEAIDNISGRGVGMNVVETEIKRIGGKIEIDNRLGFGCTFILKIPINLATINGTVVDIFGGRYIIPTLHIKNLLKPEPDQWISFKGRIDMIKIRDEIMPIIPIDKILGSRIQNIDYRNGMVIVIELEQKLKAIPVSSVIGKQEIVLKPLGPEFRNLDFVSGATILGDGRVSLILDVEYLLKND